MSANAQILSIGSELTLGRTVDTNAAWLAQQLATIGIACAKHITVGDDRAALADVIRAASSEADLVLMTGGLGPTRDDLTRDALADALGVGLKLHAPSLEKIAAFFHERKRPMVDANRVQAMIPEGAAPIDNTCGTAPGIRARLHDADIYAMPGVPREMKVMFEGAIRAALAARWDGRVLLQHTLHAFGAPEAELGQEIADLMRPGRNPSVGTSAGDWIISIRMDAQADSTDEARQLLNADAEEIRGRLGLAVFGEEKETLADAVARLLIDQCKTVSTAESCTGGLLAKWLTDVSGSSAYMVQGFVTYANEAKHRLLDVPMALIEAHGAVSPQVAEAMATNCRRISGTDYALATTGIAGPTGGTSTKPIGLVYIALATPEEILVKELLCGDSLPRRAVRDRAVKSALNLLRLRLLKMP